MDIVTDHVVGRASVAKGSECITLITYISYMQSQTLLDAVLDDKYAKIESTTTREYYRVISPTKAVLEIGASASLHTKPTGAFSREKLPFFTILQKIF